MAHFKNNYMDDRIEKIEASIEKIKENHLAHIETDLAKLQTDVGWLLKYHWVIATASVGGLIAGLFNLLK